MPADHSNGLWLTPLDTVGAEAEALVREGGVTALKLRRGRDRLADDIACIAAGPASAAGVPISTRPYPEIAARLMRVTDTAHWLAWQDGADPVLQQPFRIDNGALRIPDRPGQGIAWDEKAVARYAY